MSAPTDPGPVPFRILPRVTDANRHFWQGGAEGELRFLRCADCGELLHPPQPICPSCHGSDVAPHAVSGRARLATFTINHQPWMPGPELPYVVGIVEIEEQPSVRLTTNIVGCAIEDVHIGMPLVVTFESHDDPDDPDGPGVHLPLFTPEVDDA